MTVESILNGLFRADVVFLKTLKPIGEEGRYQFMRASAGKYSLWSLLQTVARLSNAGIIGKDEYEAIKGRICNRLVEEFAAKCPPSAGKAYRWAGFEDEVPTLVEVQE